MESVVTQANSFPATTYDKLVERNNSIASHICFLREEEERLAKRRAHLEYVQSLLYSLLTSWRHEQLGKHRGPSIFLIGKHGDLVIAEELADPKMMRTERRKIVPLAEVQHADCPDCGDRHPILWWHNQTRDSVSGDEWLTRKLLLCTKEPDMKVIEIERKCS